MFDYVCVSAGEGARNQKEASERERCKTMQTHSTQNILFTTSRIQLGRLAPLKAMVCVSFGKSAWDSTVFLPVSEKSV